jgi:hypothetical protein
MSQPVVAPVARKGTGVIVAAWFAGILILCLTAVVIAVGVSKGNQLDEAVDHGDAVAACWNEYPNQPLEIDACIKALP